MDLTLVQTGGNPFMLKTKTTHALLVNYSKAVIHSH